MNRAAMNHKLDWMALTTVCLGLAVGFAGCGPHTRQFEPAVAPQTLTDIQFIHYLETAPVVTFEEGCRAMLLAADGDDAFANHADRYAELVRRGVVRDAWGLEADHVLDHGTLAYMMVQVGNLPPSVNSHLFGSWGLGDRRYAVRQAVDEGLMRYAAAYQSVTGGELVWSVARLDEWLADTGRYVLDSAVAP